MKNRIIATAIIGCAGLFVSNAAISSGMATGIAPAALAQPRQGSWQQILNQEIERSKQVQAGDLMVEMVFTTREKGTGKVDTEQRKYWQNAKENKRRVDSYGSINGKMMWLSDGKTEIMYSEKFKQAIAYVDRGNTKHHIIATPSPASLAEWVVSTTQEKMGQWDTYHVTAKPGPDSHIWVDKSTVTEYWIDRQTGTVVRYVSANSAVWYEMKITKMDTAPAFPNGLFQLPEGVKASPTGA
jgi:hypothetical protein